MPIALFFVQIDAYNISITPLWWLFPFIANLSLKRKIFSSINSKITDVKRFIAYLKHNLPDFDSRILFHHFPDFRSRKKAKSLASVKTRNKMSAEHWTTTDATYSWHKLWKPKKNHFQTNSSSQVSVSSYQ